MDAESYIVNSGEEMICADLRTEGDAEFIAHAREDMQCLLSSLGSCDAILAAVLDLCEATDTETNEPLQGWLVDSIRAALASGKD